MRVTLHLGLLIAGWLTAQPAGSVPQREATAQELPVQRIAGEWRLTESDEAQLNRLVRSHGKAWLILEAQPGQMAGNWTIQVFLQPTDAVAPIRRGKVLFLSARAATGATDLENWTLTVHDYAQVPIKGGGLFSRASTDLPFVEFHRLPDADLLSLVAFVRACPCQPETGGTVGGPVAGKSPIGSVRLGQGGVVEVHVQRDRSSGWLLDLRRGIGTWRLIAIRFVIA